MFKEMFSCFMFNSYKIEKSREGLPEIPTMVTVSSQISLLIIAT